jgi:hypothetical protein
MPEAAKVIALLWAGGAGESVGALLEGTAIVLTEAGFEAGAFRVTARGLRPDRSYQLQVNTDAAGGFSAVAGSPPFGGSDSHTFVDPSPRAGTALYLIREVAP